MTLKEALTVILCVVLAIALVTLCIIVKSMIYGGTYAAITGAK